MSGLDDLASTLGIHHRDDTAASGGDDRLADEMKVTFGVEELASFYGGFAGLDATELYRMIDDAG